MNSYILNDRLLYQFIKTNSQTIIKTCTHSVRISYMSSYTLNHKLSIWIHTYLVIISYMNSYALNCELLYEFTICKEKFIFELYIIWKVFITWDDTWSWPSDKHLGLLSVMTNSLVTQNFMKRNLYSVWDKATDLILMHVILFFDISFRLRVLA